MDEWIKKLGHTYTMKFYSAIKKNQIILFARRWMELEVTMLSEIRQSHKDKYQHFLSLVEVRKNKTRQKQNHESKRVTTGR
jgi:hypothetical protein